MAKRRCRARIPNCAYRDDPRAQCLLVSGHGGCHEALGFGARTPEQLDRQIALKAFVIWFDEPIRVRKKRGR